MEGAIVWMIRILGNQMWMDMSGLGGGRGSVAGQYGRVLGGRSVGGEFVGLVSA